MQIASCSKSVCVFLIGFVNVFLWFLSKACSFHIYLYFYCNFCSGTLYIWRSSLLQAFLMCTHDVFWSTILSSIVKFQIKWCNHIHFQIILNEVNYSSVDYHIPYWNIMQWFMYNIVDYWLLSAIVNLLWIIVWCRYSKARSIIHIRHEAVCRLNCRFKSKYLQEFHWAYNWKSRCTQTQKLKTYLMKCCWPFYLSKLWYCPFLKSGQRSSMTIL